MTKDTKAKLKAFFAEKFMGCEFDTRGNKGCDTCGYGATEGMTLEKINEVIDGFDEEKIQ